MLYLFYRLMKNAEMNSNVVEYVSSNCFSATISIPVGPDLAVLLL